MQVTMFYIDNQLEILDQSEIERKGEKHFVLALKWFNYSRE